MGTSPVSSTSTLVERGDVVGKWIMQLSMQVSVSELANTKDLYITTAEFRPNAIIPCMFLEYFDCRS